MNQSIFRGIADSKSSRTRICPLLPKHVSQWKGRDLCDVSVNNVSHLSLFFWEQGKNGSPPWMTCHNNPQVAALENSRFVGAMSGLDWRIPCRGL